MPLNHHGNACEFVVFMHPHWNVVLNRWLCGAALGAFLGLLGGTLVEGANSGPVTAVAVLLTALLLGLATAASDHLWDGLCAFWELLSTAFWRWP